MILKEIYIGRKEISKRTKGKKKCLLNSFITNEKANLIFVIIKAIVTWTALQEASLFVSILHIGKQTKNDTPTL